MELFEMSKEAPPCEGCPDKPPTLRVSNVLAWQIWSLANKRDRVWAVGMAAIPLSIPSQAILGLTEAMGGTERDFEKVNFIEDYMGPEIQKYHQKDK